jgi:hypothetical protein
MVRTEIKMDFFVNDHEILFKLLMKKLNIEPREGSTEKVQKQLTETHLMLVYNL